MTDPQPASTMTPLLDAITAADLKARCKHLAASLAPTATVHAVITNTDAYLVAWVTGAENRYYSAKPDFEAAFAKADAWAASRPDGDAEWRSWQVAA